MNESYHTFCVCVGGGGDVGGLPCGGEYGQCHQRDSPSLCQFLSTFAPSFVCVCARESVWESEFVCVCVCERERDRERERGYVCEFHLPLPVSVNLCAILCV